MQNTVPNRSRLFIRLMVYYAVLILVLALLATLWPGAMEYLPFGGLEVALDNMQGSASLEEEIIASYHPIDNFTGAIQLFMAMTGTLLVMLPIRWIYTGLNATNYRPGIAVNLIMLPLVVTGIAAIVQHSLALAFSLAGIVAGVSYRTRLKDATDALYIFFSIGVGLAAGTQSMGIALVMSLFFAFTLLALFPREQQASLETDSPESES